ncbi:Ribosomal protein S18 acetylase RimI [Tessaracoccus bendigoensis DSM 12906]|uniref:Ribosomal protein S18 acetylase RimI n=1 Tax=Tessaracoccus bendigoensis DSM 12906 TaxID=1123357 RepID=A0A1M6CLC1_9ACTN|nr:GNAT family N-acetyltransferase [Tessaracoccus bendigoensis]SHI61759.1 Ribosomal protein S18 acetylase RimI [Tessaracoccus bendigoensis DSM 12906]
MSRIQPAAEAYVEPHLRWRFLNADDADEVEHFRGQLEALDNSVLSGLSAAVFEGGSEQAEGLAVGGWDAYNSLSAFSSGVVVSTDPLRLYLMGGVHPVHRHMLIGTAMLKWQVARAIAWRDAKHPGVPMWLGCYAELGRPGLERVAAAHGFRPERYYYDLFRDLTTKIKVPDADGIAVEPFCDSDAEEVRVLHNLCFRPLGGSDVDVPEWEGHLGEPEFRADWSFVARDGERIVGYAMSVEDDGEPGCGWTERFGVHPDYRRRGISLTLLGKCLLAMRGSGCTEAGIGIDTPDGYGLSKLTEALGYVKRDAVALLSRVV